MAIELFKKLKGDVSHTVAPRSQVLTPRDQMFTGEVNNADYTQSKMKCKSLFKLLLKIIQNYI